MTEKTENLYDFFIELLELVRYMIRRWIELHEKYGNVINSVRDIKVFLKYADQLDEASMGRLFRAILDLATISEKFPKLIELNVDELREIEKKIDNILNTLKPQKGG